MDTSASRNRVIAGVYEHFKGNRYTAFCCAKDENDTQYVLYRAEYGDRDYWIRPVDMFYALVNDNGVEKKRFALKKQIRASDQISNLVSQLSRGVIITVKSSESSESVYTIAGVDTRKKFVLLCKNGQSGYLSDHEIAHRLGFGFFRVDDNVREIPLTGEYIKSEKKLSVGKNVDLKRLNPCSIDLQIDNNCFIVAKKKEIDIQSVEHIAYADELWKPAKVYFSKGNIADKYIKIHPKETILTHTLEEIYLPSDCAGKIEIKSTFARLSLSVTNGDFCNPGYRGKFPIEITNHGRHTIVLHGGAEMLQLMLVPVNGVVRNYSRVASLKNEEGVDDGTPYGFWKSRALEQLRRMANTQAIVEAYYDLRKAMEKATGDEDINLHKEKFDRTFPPYSQKCLRKSSSKPNAEKVVKEYVQKERFWAKVKSLAWLWTIIGAILPLIFTFIRSKMSGWAFAIAIGISIVLLLLAVYITFKMPSVYCTFKRLDIEAFFRNPKYKDDILGNASVETSTLEGSVTEPEKVFVNESLKSLTEEMDARTQKKEAEVLSTENSSDEAPQVLEELSKRSEDSEDSNQDNVSKELAFDEGVEKDSEDSNCGDCLIIEDDLEEKS